MIIIVVVLFVVAIFVVRFLRFRGQRRKLEGYASSRGWSFAAQDASLDGRYLAGFPFGRGHAPRFRNVLGFQAGAYAAESFDYQYTESGRSSDDSDTVERFHVVGLQLPQPLPQLHVERVSRIPGVLGRIRFESEEFNKRWAVRGEHPLAVHDLIHQGMMEWLLSQDTKLSLNLQDTTLFTFEKGQQKPERIDEMVAFLTAFVERIPRHAWQKAEAGEYPRPKRYRTTQDLGNFLKAARDAMEPTTGP